MWILVKSSMSLPLTAVSSPFLQSGPQKHKNTTKTVALRFDTFILRCVRLWFLCTPSSPGDKAAHLSLLWVHKRIQHHIRGAQELWLRGWGFHEADLQTSSTPMYTKPQTDHHITEILLWCAVVTSFMASRITDLPNIPPSGSAWVSQTLKLHSWIRCRI